MKFCTLLILLVLIIPNTFGQEEFDNDTIINKLFNKEEIADLEKIMGFFEKEIERILKENEAYHDSINLYKNYLNFISIPPENRDFDTFLSINAQLKLYDTIGESTFNKIWEFSVMTLTETMQDYKSITYKHDGHYVLFLKELGDKYSNFESYHRIFKAMGCISASMWWHPIIGHDKYNLNDIKVKLFVAIHFMTINDREKRDEKITVPNTLL